MKHPVTARLRALRRHAFRRRRNVPGSSPGSLQPVPGTGDAGLAPARLLLLRYTAEGLLQEQADVAIEAAGSAAGPALALADAVPAGPAPLVPVWPLPVAIALLAAARNLPGAAPRRPAPLYLRPADAAPPRDPAPVLLP